MRAREAAMVRVRGKEDKNTHRGNRAEGLAPCGDLGIESELHLADGCMEVLQMKERKYIRW